MAANGKHDTRVSKFDDQKKNCRPPPPHERGERKRSKPALNGAFGLSGSFSPKGVVLLQFFFVLSYPSSSTARRLAHIDPGSVREVEGHLLLKITLLKAQS
jgi:hypothetical protein